jgi:hypothetical protein
MWRSSFSAGLLSAVELPLIGRSSQTRHRLEGPCKGYGHRRVAHQWTRVTRMPCPDRGSSLTSNGERFGASIARLVGTFQHMSVAVDDMQVWHAPIVQQVRPRHTPILAPDAIERYAVIYLRILPEATARLAATTRLKPSQQRRLFARRVPELPCDDACAMPAGALVRALAPQVDMPPELIDWLSAHAAETQTTGEGILSIRCGRDTECWRHSVLSLAELPHPTNWLAASHRQGAREAISADGMVAPIGVDRETRRRWNERSDERPAEHVRRKNVGQGFH